MSKLLLLYLTFVAGMVFILLPDYSKQYDFFLFYDIKLSVSTYVYFLWEKIIVIILAYIIANEAEEYRAAIWVFFWLLCADLVDFILSYGAIWYNLNGLPVSMNTVKVLIFGLTIIWVWVNKHILSQR